MASLVERLHSQIMNLPCKPWTGGLVDFDTAYKFGHKDARHAAAELASSELTRLQAERDADAERLEAAQHIIGQLRVELEAARVDAQRYRWLRAVNDGDCAVFEIDMAGLPQPFKILVGGHLDDFCDAAIKETKA